MQRKYKTLIVNQERYQLLVDIVKNYKEEANTSLNWCSKYTTSSGCKNSNLGILSLGEYA